MAVDNVFKRQSVVGISLYSMGGVLRNPKQIGFAQNRRQAIGYGYYGILAGSGVAPAAVAPQIVRIGAYGLLSGAGKTPIGRGF